MNEGLAIAPHDTSPASAPAPIKFFVVSRRKLMVLYLATLEWKSAPTAGIMTALIVISDTLDRCASRSIGSPVTDILSLLIMLPLLAYFLSVQDQINLVCGDPEGEGNARFTAANYGWIALGAVFWLFALIGLLMPG
ncbi:hypothetical protein [Duganella aceris]|uniref:Uncharacterized protein n=1 Tax=Duganella aceris TaxID=2703883 RepID=A0ABX0FF81_9BURK|nr:hypothetical protein [Duganella aceris]NGZ83196.1 hypothetical protein [Duganella aceris]